MKRAIPFTILSALLTLAVTASASYAFPVINTSIPGLESSINRRIDIAASRGMLNPNQIASLRSRLSRVEQKEQYLISTGRFNGFERTRVTQELESLSASLHVDTSFNRFGRPLSPWR